MHPRREGGSEVAFTQPPSPALHTKWCSDDASQMGGDCPRPGNRVSLSVRPGCLCRVQEVKAGVLLQGLGCKMGLMTVKPPSP